MFRIAGIIFYLAPLDCCFILWPRCVIFLRLIYITLFWVFLMKKGAVVENSVGILIAVAIMVVVIFLGVKGFGAISDVLSKNQEVEFKDALYASFDKIRNMGYGSFDTFSIKGYGKIRKLCFVDIAQAESINEETFPDTNLFQIIQSGQTNNVFLIGEENYYNVGEITIDSNKDGKPDILSGSDPPDGDTNGDGFICIESGKSFQYVLTNMGRSVMVSAK